MPIDPEQVASIVNRILGPEPPPDSSQGQKWRDPQAQQHEAYEKQAMVDRAFPNWLKAMGVTLEAMPAILAGPAKKHVQTYTPRLAKALDRIVPVVNAEIGEFNPLTHAAVGDKLQHRSDYARLGIDKPDWARAIGKLDPHEWLMTLNPSGAMDPAVITHEGLHALYRAKNMGGKQRTDGLFPAYDWDTLSKVAQYYAQKLRPEQLRDTENLYKVNFEASPSNNKDFHRQFREYGKDFRHALIDAMSKHSSNRQKLSSRDDPSKAAAHLEMIMAHPLLSRYLGTPATPDERPWSDPR